MMKHGPWLMPLGALLFLAAVLVLAWWPDKWDRATVVKICRNGTPILRVDGEYWARRSGFARYRVENPETVCQ